MLKELLRWCFPRSWWQSPIWVLRFSWTSSDVQMMLPTLKIKFLQGALDFRLYNSLRVTQNALLWNSRQCIRILCDSSWLCLAWTQPDPMTPIHSDPTYFYYWPEQHLCLLTAWTYAPMIPSTAICPCLVPDQESEVLARFPYSISFRRRYSTANKRI